MPKLAVIPVPSLRTQRQLRYRHDNMMYWWHVAQSDSDYEVTWKLRVDWLFRDIERSIYLMGYNPLDHSRKPKEDA